MAKKKRGSRKKALGEWVELDQVREDPRNANDHPDRNLEDIEASLREFGQVLPLVVDLKGTTIGGAGTLRVIRKLAADADAQVRADFQTVFVYRVDAKDKRARALGLALNKAGESSRRDPKKVAKILGDLKGEDLLRAAGWKPDEARRLIDRTLAQARPRPTTRKVEPGFQVVVEVESSDAQGELAGRLEGEGFTVSKLRRADLSARAALAKGAST